jgi:hypothetical protein
MANPHSDGGNNTTVDLRVVFRGVGVAGGVLIGGSREGFERHCFGQKMR